MSCFWTYKLQYNAVANSINCDQHFIFHCRSHQTYSAMRVPWPQILTTQMSPLNMSTCAGGSTTRGCPSTKWRPWGYTEKTSRREERHYGAKMWLKATGIQRPICHLIKYQSRLTLGDNIEKFVKSAILSPPNKTIIQVESYR